MTSFKKTVDNFFQIDNHNGGSLSAVAILTFLFAITIPIANWMISNVGTICTPQGLCLIPVGFGLMAPSGVLVIGIALVLRDLVQRYGGLRAALLAIIIGGILSWYVAPPALVFASVTAFTLAELADLAVYTPLRERRLALAVLLSGLVGSFIDSAIFLYLAFGSLTFVLGQFVGKMWASVFGYLVILFLKWFEANRRKSA